MPATSLGIVTQANPISAPFAYPGGDGIFSLVGTGVTQPGARMVAILEFEVGGVWNVATARDDNPVLDDFDAVLHQEGTDVLFTLPAGNVRVRLNTDDPAVSVEAFVDDIGGGGAAGQAAQDVLIAANAAAIAAAEVIARSDTLQAGETIAGQGEVHNFGGRVWESLTAGAVVPSPLTVAALQASADFDEFVASGGNFATTDLTTTGTREHTLAHDVVFKRADNPQGNPTFEVEFGQFGAFKVDAHEYDASGANLVNSFRSDHTGGGLSWRFTGQSNLTIDSEAGKPRDVIVSAGNSNGAGGPKWSAQNITKVEAILDFTQNQPVLGLPIFEQRFWNTKAGAGSITGFAGAVSVGMYKVVSDFNSASGFAWQLEDNPCGIDVDGQLYDVDGDTLKKIAYVVDECKSFIVADTGPTANPETPTRTFTPNVTGSYNFVFTGDNVVNTIWFQLGLSGSPGSVFDGQAAASRLTTAAPSRTYPNIQLTAGTTYEIIVGGGGGGAADNLNVFALCEGESDPLVSLFRTWTRGHSSGLPVQYSIDGGGVVVLLRDHSSVGQSFRSADDTPGAGESQFVRIRYKKNAGSDAGLLRLFVGNNTADFNFNYVDTTTDVRQGGAGVLPEVISSREDAVYIEHLVKFTGWASGALWGIWPGISDNVFSGYHSSFQGDLCIAELDFNATLELTEQQKTPTTLLLERWEHNPNFPAPQQVVTDGRTATRLSAGIAMFQGTLPKTPGETQTVRMVLARQPGVNESTRFRLVRTGQAQDLLINLDTGSVGTTHVSYVAPTLNSVSVTDNTIEIVATFTASPTLATDWSFQPDYLNANTANTEFIDILELDLDYTIPVPRVVQATATTGRHLVSTDRPAAVIVVDPGTPIVTSFDLTQYTQGIIDFHFIDQNAAHGWVTASVDIERLLLRHAQGANPDFSVTLFDNDFVTFELTDPATGTFTLNDSGRAMSYQRSELWVVANQPAYANDGAAAVGGVPVGGIYQNTTTGFSHTRLV